MLGKKGVGLDGEVVNGNMRRIKAQCSLDILLQFEQRLARQGVHQIQIEGLEGRLRLFNGGHGLISIVHTAKRFELRIIEALHTNGQTRHACRPKGFEAIFLKGAWVGFKGDFGLGFQR